MPSKPSKLPLLTVTITPEDLAWVRQHSLQTHIPISRILRDALALYRQQTEEHDRALALGRAELARQREQESPQESSQNGPTGQVPAKLSM